MNRVFVGDRANSRVVAFDARTFEVDGIVPAGQGVFHMWGNSATRELWVNNDIDNTTTVIDMRTLEVLATVPTPADLVADGGKPHDVILSPTGLFAYVTVIGVAGDNDYVVQYFTPTRMEMNRTAVGKDVHVSLSNQNEKLFVPCQNTSNVYVLNQVSLNVMDIIDVPGAHGAGMPKNGRYFYTTNLPGGGTDGLFTIDTRTHELVGEPTDTPYTVPHNIALTSNGRKLYLTHSGATNDKVTVYRTTPQHPAPELIGEVTVGMNPFGLAYVP
jgi:DNA-binding beta-propeller fold protein YncE